MKFKLVGDHYSILDGDYVIGLIMRNPNDPTWSLHRIAAGYEGTEYCYVSLQEAMRTARQWKRLR